MAPIAQDGLMPRCRDAGASSKGASPPVARRRGGRAHRVARGIARGVWLRRWVAARKGGYKCVVARERRAMVEPGRRSRRALSGGSEAFCPRLATPDGRAYSRGFPVQGGGMMAGWLPRGVAPWRLALVV